MDQQNNRDGLGKDHFREVIPPGTLRGMTFKYQAPPRKAGGYGGGFTIFGRHFEFRTWRV